MLRRRSNLIILLAYILLMVTASWARLATYDRYLPLLDYSDESNMFLFSMDMRGVDEAPLADDYGAHLTSDWLTGYPPLYLWLGVWGQRYVDATYNGFVFPGDYINAMRLISVFSNVTTIIFLLWIGWLAASPLGREWSAIAGWFTALPYALNPQVVDVGNLAIPDSLIPLACALTLLGTVAAICYDRPAWLVLSLVGAIGAIYLKYSLLFTLWLPFCGVLVAIRKRGWRALAPWLAAMAVISVLAAGYLLWGYGALGLENQEAQGFRERGLVNMFDLNRNLVNLWVAVDVSVGLWLFVTVLGVGIVAYIISARRVVLRGLWLLLPYVLGNMLLTSSVVYANLERGGYGRIRFMFPAALAVSLIWAMSAVQVSIWLQKRSQKVITTGFIAIISLLFVIPSLWDNWQLVRQYDRLHTNHLLWNWSDASIPPEGKILVSRDSLAHLVWNRPYSGYDGETTFEWVHDDHPEQGTPQQAYEAGIAYFVMTDEDQEEVFTTDQFNEFLEELWHLKTITADGTHIAGETTSVYRMLPPQVETDVFFGNKIKLIGYDLDTTIVNAAESVKLRLYWQAHETPEVNHSMFVHLYPTGQPTEIVAQFDGTPVSEKRLPATWTDPNEKLIGATIILTIPESTPTGDYIIAIGLYDFQTGMRLPVNGEDRFEIEIDIVNNS